MTRKQGWGKRLLAAGASVLVMAALPGAARAQGSAAISQSYTAASGAIVAGALVSVSGNSSARNVQLATLDSVNSLVGVAASDPLLALSGSNSARQVQVIMSGTAQTLVSDINGPVQAGDKITASPISGVGMAASSNIQVVGTAEAGLDAAAAKTQTITDRAGKRHSVHIGEVPVQISVSYYTAPTSKFLPPFVQSFADSVAGKPVSLIRISAASLLAVISLASVFVVLYSATRSGIISIGRNPLAAGAIRRGLLEVGLTIVLLLAGTAVAVDLILTL